MYPHAAQLKDHERELRAFQLRVGIAAIAVLAAFALLFVRFFYLQVVQHELYAARAEDNRISIVPLAPNRGLILDRKGVVLARNYSAYTLEISPSRVTDLERTIAELAEIVDIQARDRTRLRRLLAETRNADSVPIRTRLSDSRSARACFASTRSARPHRT